MAQKECKMDIVEQLKNYAAITDMGRKKDDKSLFRKAAKEIEALRKELKYRRDKERMFFECCSCLFAEGVEFMNKAEIYDAIKRECKKLESELHR